MTYHVSSSQDDRMELEQSASAEGHEAAAATWPLGSYDFSSDAVRAQADAAFETAWSLGEERGEPFADDRDEAREWYIEGYMASYLEVGRSFASRAIRNKLDLSAAELDALYGMGNIDGNAVADRIASANGLPEDWRESGGLGEQLVALGVLTVAEGQFLDDED